MLYGAWRQRFEVVNSLFEPISNIGATIISMELCGWGGYIIQWLYEAFDSG